MLILKKLNLVMKDIGAIGKEGTNTSQGYKFRGIDQLLNAAHPVLVKHGVVIIPEVLSSTVEMRDVTRSNGKAGVDKHVQLRVKFSFYAEDGSVVSAVTEGEGLDSGDKATNKAMSGALKYALIQTLSIPTEDMADADLDSPELTRTAKPVASKSSVAATPSQPATATVASAQAVASTPPVASSASTGAPQRASSFRNRKLNGAASAATVKPATTQAVTNDSWE